MPGACTVLLSSTWCMSSLVNLSAPALPWNLLWGPRDHKGKLWAHKCGRESLQEQLRSWREETERLSVVLPQPLPLPSHP